MVLDFFSNQEISSTISKRMNFLIPSSVNFPDYLEFFDTELFQTRNNLINEKHTSQERSFRIKKTENRK